MSHILVFFTKGTEVWFGAITLILDANILLQYLFPRPVVWGGEAFDRTFPNPAWFGHLIKTLLIWKKTYMIYGLKYAK